MLLPSPAFEGRVDQYQTLLESSPDEASQYHPSIASPDFQDLLILSPCSAIPLGLITTLQVNFIDYSTSTLITCFLSIFEIV